MQRRVDRFAQRVDENDGEAEQRDSGQRDREDGRGRNEQIAQRALAFRQWERPPCVSVAPCRARTGRSEASWTLPLRRNSTSTVSLRR